MSDWDEKIQEAETLLVKVEAKAVRLREAITTFKAMAAQSERQTSDPCHSV